MAFFIPMPQIHPPSKDKCIPPFSLHIGRADPPPLRSGRAGIRHQTLDNRHQIHLPFSLPDSFMYF